MMPLDCCLCNQIQHPTKPFLFSTLMSIQQIGSTKNLGDSTLVTCFFSFHSHATNRHEKYNATSNPTKFFYLGFPVNKTRIRKRCSTLCGLGLWCVFVKFPRHIALGQRWVASDSCKGNNTIVCQPIKSCGSAGPCEWSSVVVLDYMLLTHSGLSCFSLEETRVAGRWWNDMQK